MNFLTKLPRLKLTKRSYALVICVVIIGITSLLWSIRVGSTPLLLNAKATRIDITVGPEVNDGAAIEIPEAYSFVRVDNLRQVELRKSSSGKEAGPLSIISDGKGTLSRIPVRPGDKVVFEVFASGQLNVSVRGASGTPRELIGTVTGTTKIVPTKGDPLTVSADDKNPETFKATLGTVQSPMVLYYRLSSDPEKACGDPASRPANEPLLRQTSIAKIGFVTEKNAQESLVVSSILSGRLSFVALGDGESLAKSEIVRLTLRNAHLVNLNVSQFYLDATVTGVAEQLELGTADHMRDARPTYLDLLWKDKNVALFLSAAFAAWGFFWGLKEVVVGEDK